MDIKEAIETLIKAGAVVQVGHETHLSLAAAAAKLDCSISYLRTHKDEFPNLWRMPGGELRIPERDVAALASRNRIRRVA